LLERKRDRSWRRTIEQDVDDWWKVLEARAMNDANPINPQRVFHELSPRLPDLAVISADSGSGANWFARHLKIRPGMMASLSGTLATMGPGVPYAIAAKFCHPSRFVLAIAGDGAMQMNGINGLITISKYWQEWRDPRLVVLVLNNGDLNQVTWEQRALAGDPRFAESQAVPDFGYARYAESLGLMGVRIDRPDQIGGAWDRVITADRPAVLEAIVDPDVPPLPPHISWEQAKNFASSVFRGDAEALGFIRQTIKDVADTYLPRRT
jgi:pyruvate dehydrogenase (quinone)